MIDLTPHFLYTTLYALPTAAQLAIWCGCSYLLGSISFAVVVSAVMGLNDPRTYGSKNPGATNVLRTGNTVAAALTLLGDGAKGWLAVWLVLNFALPMAQVPSDEWVASVLLAVFLGHLFPVFFRFVGGKGVATALGILLAIDPLLGAIIFGIWLLVAKISRYSSLAALLAAVAAPLVYGVLYDMGLIFGSLVVMSGLLMWRHRSNITQLINGQESKIGARKAS
jgi:glycerol-3-phosphate acyltransferase PlsY